VLRDEDCARDVTIDAIAIRVLKRVVRFVRAERHVAEEAKERHGVRGRQNDVARSGSGCRRLPDV